MFNRISSHMCGRWYLAMFLLRDGLLTLIYKASLMVLMRFWSSLSTMLKLSMVTVWPEVLKWSYIGEGDFWCSINLSANDPADSPIYFSSHSTLSHLYLYVTPLFLRIGSLSFGAIRRFLMVSAPLKCTCTPCFLYDLLTDYIKKSEELLSQSTYKTIPTDQTPKYKKYANFTA